MAEMAQHTFRCGCQVVGEAPLVSRVVLCKYHYDRMRQGAKNCPKSWRKVKLRDDDDWLDKNW